MWTVKYELWDVKSELWTVKSPPVIRRYYDERTSYALADFVPTIDLDEIYVQDI